MLENVPNSGTANIDSDQAWRRITSELVGGSLKLLDPKPLPGTPNTYWVAPSRDLPKRSPVILNCRSQRAMLQNSRGSAPNSEETS